MSQPISAEQIRKSWWASGAPETQPVRLRDAVVEHLKNGLIAGAMSRLLTHPLARPIGAVFAVTLTAGSAILVKEWRADAVPLPMVETIASASQGRTNHARVIPASTTATNANTTNTLATTAHNAEGHGTDVNHRWFNGRPVRPARTMTMVVTAYSPDWRSCGKFADGKTATLHSVTTNAGKLVAADPRILPYGSMLSIPGYDDMNIVPVLDCGGAIKGRRLDLLFPTHEEALEWGRQTIKVTVWEYADGLPMDNPRKLR